jgi:hypothetical protein
MLIPWLVAAPAQMKLLIRHNPDETINREHG